jgi:hypothetical protein
MNHAPTVDFFLALKKNFPIEKSACKQQNFKISSIKTFFRLALARRKQRVVHFLHIGKTGGTAMKAALQPRAQNGHFFLFLHGHEVTLKDVPVGERVVFFLRDPVSRFVSGFNSRLRQGQPRYLMPWSPSEKIIFERFVTPNALALALSSGHADERAAAENAMRSIGHIRDHYARWFGGEEGLLGRRSDIFLIGFQETLVTDFEKLRVKLELPADVVLPVGEVAAHKTPSNFDTTLEPLAVENLQRWYREDIRFYQLCRQIAV